MLWAAKGIALIDEHGDQPSLRYVFDICDTHRVRGGRPPFIWSLGEEYRDRMVDHLVETYGLEDWMPIDLLEPLQEIASRSAQEGIEDLWREALDQSADSYLEGSKHTQHNNMNCSDSPLLQPSRKRCTV